MRLHHIFPDAHMRGLVINFEQDAAARLRALTKTQRRVMELMIDGQPSKIIAFRLGISQRTAENHRAAIMERTGARSIVDLLRFAILADAEIEIDGDERPN